MLTKHIYTWTNKQFKRTHTHAYKHEYIQHFGRVKL